MINARPHMLSTPLNILPVAPRFNAAPPISFPSCNPFNYSMLGQILVACVKQAKINDSFAELSARQQKIILKSVWTECFVLRASHWPIDIIPIFEQWVPFNWILWEKKIQEPIVFLTFFLLNESKVWWSNIEAYFSGDQKNSSRFIGAVVDGNVSSLSKRCSSI